jgi:3-methyl-2-oxobutanoate hydroxymethyltransferase
MLGISQNLPRFSKNFLKENSSIEEALTAYGNAVRDGSFPASEHCFQ